jgi:hypothetical protein
MNQLIKETAIRLKEKYETAYKEWARENPGYVMHGSIIKSDALNKASYCETIQEVESLKIAYDVSIRAMESGPHGFVFNRDAIIELLEELKNTNLYST